MKQLFIGYSPSLQPQKLFILSAYFDIGTMSYQNCLCDLKKDHVHIYMRAVNYTILTKLDEDINILICSALLVRLPEHKHRAVWLMATKNIKFKSLGIGYICIKFNGLIVPATAFFSR